MLKEGNNYGSIVPYVELLPTGTVYKPAEVTQKRPLFVCKIALLFSQKHEIIRASTVVVCWY